MSRNLKRWYAAYHEAGHALIRHLCGYAIGDLWIAPDGSGGCAGEGGETEWMRLDDALLVWLGGYAGEMRAPARAGQGLNLATFLQCEAPDLVRARFLAERMAHTQFMERWAAEAMGGPPEHLTDPTAILHHYWQQACDMLQQDHGVHRDFAVALHTRRRFRPGEAALLLGALITKHVTATNEPPAGGSHPTAPAHTQGERS